MNVLCRTQEQGYYSEAAVGGKSEVNQRPDNMTKHLLTAAVLCIAVGAMAMPARAGEIDQTLTINNDNSGNPICNGDVCYYDSPDGYDFSSTFPTADPTTIGSFGFSIPVGDVVTGITISGTFGNGDSGTTALSDYYLGYSGDETAVEVASCDDTSDDCYTGGLTGGPNSWTDSLSSSDLNTLASAIGDGSLDFTYTWDDNTEVTDIGLQYVYAGDPAIDIQYSAATPEPSTIPICFGGFAGILVWRARQSRFRVR